MEINSTLKLTVEESTLLDMHSVINVLGVISWEIYNLRELLGEQAEIDLMEKRTTTAADHLRDPVKAAEVVSHVEETITTFGRAVSALSARAPAEQRDSVAAIHENLNGVFDVLRVRAREIVARHKNPDAWVSHNIDELRNNFTQVLRAIEQNSRGGYRIVYNVAEHESSDYLVNFQITSEERRSVRMPAIFQDVMRDLLANARKYTAPGGKIDAGLHVTSEDLRFVVQDSGVGIPENEIVQVISFGRRADNVRSRTTRGGGFGLTKAYYVTRKFGGRMWIESSTTPPTGTRITIEIPVPQQQ
jgi:signal transduction histidine kinase